MKIPKIDFKYWLNKNQTDSLNEKRFIALITKINNIYNLNIKYNQSYFCGDNIEISRLMSLNYISFENEILEKIRELKNFNNDDEILKIFDLIQIWGGLQGGSNFYNIISDTSLRLNYKAWIPKYKELIKKSISKEINAYEIVAKGEIPNLRMSFGSKHISFWSRKNNDNECLVIIDNKIAGVSGVKIALDVNYTDILSQIHAYSKEFNMKPFEIEKSLFTFHRAYFNNINSVFYAKKNDVQDKDYDNALEIRNNLNIGIEIKNKTVKVKNINKVIESANFDNYRGVLASIDWNSNHWKNLPTNEDIAKSHYDFVVKNGYTYTFLNFAHNLYPTNSNGYYEGCLPSLFTKKIDKKKGKDVKIIFIYSKDWHDNKKYIIGFYAFPDFEKNNKESPINLFNKAIVVNIMSYPEDIHYLENKIELRNPPQNGILPILKQLSRQSFNYLTRENIIKIFEEIISVNITDTYLQNIANRVIASL